MGLSTSGAGATRRRQSTAHSPNAKRLAARRDPCVAIGCGYPDGNDLDWLESDPALKLVCGSSLKPQHAGFEYVLTTTHPHAYILKLCLLRNGQTNSCGSATKNPRTRRVHKRRHATRERNPVAGRNDWVEQRTAVVIPCGRDVLVHRQVLSMWPISSQCRTTPRASASGISVDVPNHRW
jgi:hypothetical protein